jgi:hypothetical protein
MYVLLALQSFTVFIYIAIVEDVPFTSITVGSLNVGSSLFSPAPS